MSDISERLMRGQPISRRECMDHDEEIGRLLAVYPKAMAAMEAHERLMANCLCDWDGGYGEDGSQVRRIAAAGCPVAHDEGDDA